MISGFLDVSMTRKTNIINLLRHQDTSQNPRKFSNAFFNFSFCGNITMLETEKNWRKDGGRSVGNLKYGIDIFQKIWNGTLVIWDQYFLNNIRWFFNLWIFESAKLWNFESKKPRSQDTSLFSSKGIPLPSTNKRHKKGREIWTYAKMRAWISEGWVWLESSQSPRRAT